MAKRQHWVIPIANKIGFNPSSRQTTEINCRATARLLDRYNGNIPKSVPLAPENNKEFLEDIHATIREVMSWTSKEFVRQRKERKG